MPTTGKELTELGSFNSSDNSYLFGTEWAVLEAIQVFGISMSLYLFVMSLLYECKACNVRVQAATNRMPKMMMSSMILFASLLVFAIFASNQLPLLAIKWSTETACSRYRLFTTWCQNLGMAAAFMVLWLRIRLFYSHRMMQTLRSTPNRVINYVVLLVLNGSAVQQAVYFSVHVDAIRGPDDRCVAVVLSKSVLTSLIIMAISSSLCSVTLGVLLVWPLWRNRHRMSRRTSGSVHAVSRRIIAITVVCVITYILAPLVTSTMKHRNVVVPNTVYCIMFLANLLLVICSFADWRTRLLPVCFVSDRCDGSGDATTLRRTATTTVSFVTTITNSCTEVARLWWCKNIVKNFMTLHDIFWFMLQMRGISFYCIQFIT